jgi:hypothetical protein
VGYLQLPSRNSFGETDANHEEPESRWPMTRMRSRQETSVERYHYAIVVGSLKSALYAVMQTGNNIVPNNSSF